uniref:Phytosulfokine n=1 Tax=Cajanus cajan TaxID=3821 RepID=A0A151RAB0_CAJCA|nr:Phytosulfokines 3 [Cajanus cajan]
MSKLATIFIFNFYLLICFGLIYASPPNVQFDDAIFSPHGDVAAYVLDDESCEGIDECLMRRTLAAHVDYIYTQKNKP